MAPGSAEEICQALHDLQPITPVTPVQAQRLQVPDSSPYALDTILSPEAAGQAAPPGFLTVHEYPGVYASLLGPAYQQLPVPTILALDLSGGSKFFNRCARSRLVRLIETGAGTPQHGGFVLFPNPGYHDSKTRKARMHTRGAATSPASPSVAGPRMILDVTGGYVFDAWWVQPSWLPGLRDLLEVLRHEGEVLDSRGSGDAVPRPERAPSPLHRSRPPSPQHRNRAPSPRQRSILDQPGWQQPPPLQVLVPPSPASPGREAPRLRRQPHRPGGRPLSFDHTAKDYTCSGAPKDPGYLSTIRDLRGGRDLPLLEALMEEGKAWLASVTGKEPEEVFFHYPQSEAYATVHLHFRTSSYPHSEGASGRRSFHAHSVLAALKADQGCMEAVTMKFWVKPNDKALAFLKQVAGDCVQEVEPGLLSVRLPPAHGSSDSLGPCGGCSSRAMGPGGSSGGVPCSACMSVASERKGAPALWAHWGWSGVVRGQGGRWDAANYTTAPTVASRP